MPSKKRKYNARFPAGRIKKIMQTDEEVGKVAQAVPIIIYDFKQREISSPVPYVCLKMTPRTLELFVESLLSKAMQVTVTRNAKTLSPSHVKQCILAESRFDFLRDLVKNIPDVSAAEESEKMNAESSPTTSGFTDVTVPPRRIAREDSSSSSSSDIRVQQSAVPHPLREHHLSRVVSVETDVKYKSSKPATVTSSTITSETAIDLSKKAHDERPHRTANFYHDTLMDEVPQKSVITVNPSYANPQPSTSYAKLTPVEPLHRIRIPVPKPFDVRPVTPRTPITPVAPITPILNIDFTKNLTNPEIKVLDTTAANIIGVQKNEKIRHVHRQNSKTKEFKKIEVRPIPQTYPVDIDHLNSGDLQIDEDYDT